ncbi:DegT/DnrJ/EryC1/StrS family aminotransferase [Desulforhopalus sp. 52FAK]
MRIGRTLPPAASPIPLIDILQALPACLIQKDHGGRFEQEILQEFGSKYCFLLSSGKAALTLILLALKEMYPDRDRVILPAFTCYSVPAAVKRAGLKIVLCDFGRDSLDLDKEKLSKIIAEDTQDKKILCVLPTHLFGYPADVAGVEAIVGPEITVVEDAAQAMGEIVNTDKLGAIGDVGFFSLGRGKALSSMDGGIIVTKRKDVADNIRLLSAPLKGCTRLDSFSMSLKTALTMLLQKPWLFWLPKSVPFLKLGETLYEPDFSIQQLSSFQVKLAANWQKRLKSHQRARQKNNDYWDKKLPDSFTRFNRIGGSSMIRLAVLAPNPEVRDYILKQSEQHGLGIMSAYPSPINMISDISDEFSDVQFPHAEHVCDRILTLPVHEYVRPEDNEKILSLLVKYRA